MTADLVSVDDRRPLAGERRRHEPVARPIKAATFIALSLSLLPVAAAQPPPSRIVIEPPSIAVRYPDPDVRYDTPGLLAGRESFASHAEVLSYIDALSRESPHMSVEVIGHSQRGLALPLIVLSADGRVDPARPTVLILGQQHGNEPAGGEAALAVAAQLARSRASLLDRVNVLIVVVCACPLRR